MSVSEANITSQSFEARIAVATTFEELAEIALEQISKMPKPVGILCGPITSGGLGSVEANLEEFGRRIMELKSEGKSIFDQTPFEPRMQEIKKTPYYDSTRNHLLEVFYGTLYKSGLLQEFYFLPGWESSYGATWEHGVLQDLGAKITYLPTSAPI